MRQIGSVLFLLFAVDYGCAQVGKLLEQGRKHLENGDNERALKAVDDALKLEPKSAFGWYLRGECHAALRQPATAIKDFDHALQIDPQLAAAIDQRGGERFKMGDIAGSIDDFEKYIKIRPKAYEKHWRYGISLYYAGRYADGAKQFKAGEKEFGNDVENAFWHYLCQARIDGPVKARGSLLRVGLDRRVPMMKVYDLIQGKAAANDVLAAAREAALEPEAKNEALFYANLYVGLNYEAEGNGKKCVEHLTEAVKNHPIGHYMWDVANVHLKLAAKN